MSIEGSCVWLLEGAEVPGERWRNYLLEAVLLASIGVCSAATTPQGDLVTFLVSQNEAAWEKVHSFQTIQYTHETQWLAAGEQQPFSGVAQIKKKGDSYWATYRRTIIDKATGQMKENELRQVVNDKYVGEWPALGNPFAYQWDRASGNSMSQKEKTHLRVTMPYDFLPLCFGDSGLRFQEAMQKGGSAVKYEAVEVKGQDGKPLYQIKRFFPQGGPSPDLVWTIDPEKGFLAIERTFCPQGQGRTHHTIQVEQISPGIWYPVGFEETRYEETKEGTGTPTVIGWIKSKIKDIKINEPLPDGQFDISALGLLKDKPDIRVLRTGLDGVTTEYVYRAKQLVPKELAAQVDQVVKRGLEGPGVATTPDEGKSAESTARPEKATAKESQASRVVGMSRSANGHRVVVVLLASFLGILMVGAVFAWRHSKPRG